MMKKIYIILIFAQVSIITFGQQLSVNDQYFTNGYFSNPAKAGSTDNTNAFMLNRQQWIGIQGAPQTSVFSIDGKTNNKKVGLGLMLSSDIDNIFNRTTVSGTYAYHLKISEKQNISLAASAGLMNVHIAFDDIMADNTFDPLLLSADANCTSFDANFGVNYNLENLEVGLVAYQLAGTRFNYESQTEEKNVNYQLIQHFMGLINYTFTIKPEKLTVAPSVIVRSVMGIDPQLDAGFFLKYQDLIWTNIAWRQNSCVYASVGAIIYDNIIIGGSYEYNIGSISKFSGSSFEVIVGYRFGGGSQQKSSGSSVSNSDIKRLKEIAQKQSEEMDKVISENKKLNKNIKRNENDITLLKEEIERLQHSSKLNHSDKKHIDDFKATHEVKSFNTTMYTDPDSTSDGFKSEQYCVIAGAYKTVKNAKLGQKILKREINLDTYLIKNPGSSFYFIATDFFDNTKDVTEEHKRLKALHIETIINGKTWVYKAK